MTIDNAMCSPWVLDQLEVNPNFAKQIFSDETHFWMNGYVNKQNCRIWDDTNLREIHQLQMHPEKVTVWCGFWFVRNHRSVLLPKRSGRCHNRQRRALQIDDGLKWMIWIPITCGSNRMALRATHRMPRWTFCASDLRAWLSRAAATWISHRDRAI